MKEFLRSGGFETYDKIHLTSDLHLRHDNVTKFEPIRLELQEQAGFEGTPDEFLIHRYNQQVGPDDLVINLGDLHWKSFEPVADKLNGRMLLVLGNHDKAPQYYKKFPGVMVCEGVWNLNGIASQYFIDNNDQLLSGFILGDTLFSHYPIDALENERKYRQGNIIKRIEILAEIASVQEVKYNIHGHLHSVDLGLKRSLNVCFDYNKYQLLDFWDSYMGVSDG